MNVAKLIASVRSSGASLALDDDGRLRVDGWRELSMLDRERVRAYRDELVEHLRSSDDDGDDEVRPAAESDHGDDAGEESASRPFAEDSPVRRVAVRWPGVSSRAEAEARTLLKALAGRGERHEGVELFLYDMRRGECRLPICVGHVLLRAHAEGRRLDIDALDVDELRAEYTATKRWLEDLVSMMHRGELDQRTLLVRVGAIRSRDSIARLNF